MLRPAGQICAVIELRTPIGVVHDEGPVAAKLMPERKRSTDRAARIACSGLHVDAPKWRQSSHLAIGDGVHGAAAGESEIGQARSSLHSAEEMEEGFFIHRLHRARDVPMPLLKGIVRAFAAGQEAPPVVA